MRVSLQQTRLRHLPINGIKPRGWLANQLRIQRNGFSGHLDEFWPDLMDSKWFGGGKPDMWAHQYDQQVNQVLCSINEDHMWSTKCEFIFARTLRFIFGYGLFNIRKSYRAQALFRSEFS